MPPTRRATSLFLLLGALGAGCGARTSLSDAVPTRLVDLDGGPQPGTGGAGGTTTTTTSSTSSSSSTGTGAGGSVTGTVVSLGDASQMEAETHLAVHPSGVVAVAWIGIGYQGDSWNGYVFSNDFGDSWGLLGHLDSPGGRSSSDPTLAVDAAGNFYLAWVGYLLDGNGQPTDMHIYVAAAPAGSLSFGAPVEASDPNVADTFYDKPWITVTNQGTVIVTYMRVDNATLGIQAARSVDGGQSFGQVTVSQDPTFTSYRNLAYPCAPATGSRVYAVYDVINGSGTVNRVEVSVSDDDGASWKKAGTAALASAGAIGFDDPTCVADGDDLWVSYGLSNDVPMGPEDSALSHSLRVAHSSTGGSKFDPPADAGDASLNGLFLHAALAREEGGALDIVYYAGQADQDPEGSFRRARSADGLTYSPSVAFEQPLTFLGARSDPRWLGDYAGVVAQKGTLYTSYTTNAGGWSHIAFAKAPVP